MVNGKEWARKFAARFIEPGLVKLTYKGRPIISLLKKETIQAALSSLIGTPLTVGHTDRTPHGSPAEASYDGDSGWFVCNGVAETKDCVEAIRSGQRVSCGYTVHSTKRDGGTWHNIPYDEEITNIRFTHLAVVDKDDARYEDAVVILNSKSSDTPMKKATKWILKKLGLDGKPVETSGDIPAGDERLNSLIEAYRAKNRATAVPDGAFIEIDGQQVAMADLLALEVSNGKGETDEQKTARLAKEKEAAIEIENARKKGFEDFLAVAKAKGQGQSRAVDTEPFVSPDTLSHRIARGRECFGSAALAGKN